MMATPIIKVPISISPEVSPAANRRPMETCPTVPYRIIPIPGGIVDVIKAVKPITTAVKAFG